MVLPYIDQWNKTESPEINSCMYVQLMFDKRAKNTQGERRVSPINGAGKGEYPHAKE
jgi:hypothetical protein